MKTQRKSLCLRVSLFLLFIALNGCGGGTGGGNTVGTTYNVTYDGNGHTGGEVPADATEYAEGQTITVLDNTGTLVKAGYAFAGWNTSADESGTTYAAGQTFTMGQADVTLYALWVADYTSMIWNVPMEKVYYGSPAIGDDGTIYIATSEAGGDTVSTHGLYAVTPDGEIRWKYTTGVSVRSSPVIAADGTIYIMVGEALDADGLDCDLYAIDSQGQKKWECDENIGGFGIGNAHNTPALAEDGTIYVSGAHALFAIQDMGTSCRKLWSYTFEDRLYSSLFGDQNLSTLHSSPSLDDDGNIYVNSIETIEVGTGGIYAFEPDGDLLWHHRGSGQSPPTIGSDGTIYVGYGSTNYPSIEGSEPPKFVAINPDGTTKWELLTGGLWVMGQAAIDEDGTIYVGTSEHFLEVPGHFLAINPDGTLKWEYDTAPDVADDPAAQAQPPDIYVTPTIDSNGIIYFTDEVGLMWAIDKDGTVVWMRPTGSGCSWGNVLNGGFAIDDNGIFYYASFECGVGLIAFDTGSQGLATSRWPKHLGNNKNTGRSDN